MYRLNNRTHRLLFPVVAALILPLLVAAEEQEIIQPGDWLFVKARPLNCDTEKQLVDFAEVAETGTAVLLGGLTIRAAGSSQVGAAELLTDAVEQRDGYRPESIEILRADRADKKRQAILMLLVAQSQRAPCQRQPEEVMPGWKPGYQVAKRGRAKQL